MGSRQFLAILHVWVLSHKINKCAFVGTNELASTISIQVRNFKSQFALLPKVVDDLKVVRIIRVKIIVNNFGVIDFQPISLVGVPLHFEQNLSV